MPEGKSAGGGGAKKATPRTKKSAAEKKAAAKEPGAKRTATARSRTGPAFPGPGREGGSENPLRTDDVVMAPLNDDHAIETPAEVSPVVRTDAKDKPRSLWTDAWYDLRRRPIFIVSSALILLLIVVAMFPGLFTNTDPRQCELRFSNDGGSAGHPFGFTKQGCDVYSRTIYGARPSILVGLLTTIGAVALGGTLGAIAGFYGRWVDGLISRIVDVFFAIPLILGAIIFLQAFPSRSVWVVALALTVLGWTQVARIMRGSVIGVKEQDFVVAARALGASNRRILVRHILPNAVAPVIVVATISLGIYIVAEATLSFLGIGLPPSMVSWGNDISDAQTSLRTAPHVLMWPAAALSITVLSFIMLGDAVREALDPRLR